MDGEITKSLNVLLAKKEKEQIDIPSLMRELGEKLKRASTNSWTEVDYFHEDEFSIRDFGKWVIPRGAPRDEEDYDWKVPNKETDKLLFKIVKEFKKEHKKVDISVGIGEKNYIDIKFSIKLKGEHK